jgi:hypothetical protein
LHYPLLRNFSALKKNLGFGGCRRGLGMIRASEAGMRFPIAAWVVLSLQSAPLACPFCTSERGSQVRAGIFNNDFAYNALLTLIPFPALLVIVALVYWAPTRSRRSGELHDG